MIGPVLFNDSRIKEPPTRVTTTVATTRIALHYLFTTTITRRLTHKTEPRSVMKSLRHSLQNAVALTLLAAAPVSVVGVSEQLIDLMDALQCSDGQICGPVGLDL